MPHTTKWSTRELCLAITGMIFVLVVHGAVPFLTTPTLGQAVWTTGFSESMANGSLFDLYARDFGIPEPAAIAFGLAGAWPASLLARLGLQPSDAYTTMVAFWLTVGACSAYGIARQLGATKSISVFGAVVWMTLPISWAHGGYSMLSLGIALLSFYFFVACRLFLVEVNSPIVSINSIAMYFTAATVSVFMDGYTFVMFAAGSSILLLHTFVTRHDLRAILLKVALPVHVASFTLAYVLFTTYIGKTSFKSHDIIFFRSWGLDLSFLVLPTKGMLWIPDLLGASIKRTNELHFGDGSVWTTTFALPLLILGLTGWLMTKSDRKSATGFMLVAAFGFYMALGPSLKINSTKPEALQISHPRHKSILMAPEYAIGPTGNAWISENLPGFNVMRASYRWAALGNLGLWLLLITLISTADRNSKRVWLGIMVVMLLLNLPNLEKKLDEGIENRAMFQKIDQELVRALAQYVQPNEIVAFLPWRNDFFANYLAPKAGFRTFNIGGDKNRSIVQEHWPAAMLPLGDEIDPARAISSLKLLRDGTADVIVLPYFHMLWSAHFWPCKPESIIPGFFCPEVRREQLQTVINTYRSAPEIEVVDTTFFATIRLATWTETSP